MLLKENIKMALQSLRTNKMRSFLTMLGIIIGTAAVIAIMTVGNSLSTSVSEMMQSIGANDVYLTVAERSEDEEDLSQSEIEDLKIDGLHFGSAVSGNSKMTDGDYITSDMIDEMCNRFSDEIYAVNISDNLGEAEISVNQEPYTVNLIGSTVGYFLTNPITIESGNMLSASDYSNAGRSCLVAQDFVDDVYDGNADAVIGKTLEFSIDGETLPLVVVGVYSKDSGSSSMMFFGSSDTTDVYLPIQTATHFAHTEDQYSYLQVSTQVGVDPADLAAELKDFFEPYYRGNDRYYVSVVSYESLVNMLYQLLDTITLAISIIAGIALLVGGIGVMNIMLVSVTERTREIGTRKALGARNSSIRQQFIVEALVICLIGGAIGIVLGILGGVAAADRLGYPARPTIGSILFSLGFSSGIGLFFGYFPANKAAKMSPIEALRYE